jgi:uncharacterized protein
MQPSMFNVRVPLDSIAARDDVFLMNTLTDAQVIVERDVLALLDRLAEGGGPRTAEEREAIATLAGLGFVVHDRAAERRQLDGFFHRVREDTTHMRLTVLTTLQCNFACDYCIQGDHGDHNKFADRMSLETAARACAWAEARLDALGPETFGLTFFGGEPLLNLPVVYYMAERLWHACAARGVRFSHSVITNGLLLTEAVVDRLTPFGLAGVKITLDGDRDTHNRMRPLRGGQGTFDRIMRNVRAVAGKVRVSIGGNFDESSVDSYPALLDFLQQQEFADKLAKVNFKPIIRPLQPELPKGLIPLTVVSDAGKPVVTDSGKPLNGTCMTTAGGGSRASSACDGCNVLSGRMAELRDETRARGFTTSDGVHMGPCEIHAKHSYTMGPDGALFACPGFTSDPAQSTGHIDGRADARRTQAASRYERITAWHECDGCAFIPVCAGGCSVASHTELGSIERPSCHKVSFEAGVVSLAREAAAADILEPVPA